MAATTKDAAVTRDVDPVALWRDMRRMRAYDERALAMSRQGRIGTYPLFWGEEGVQAGAVAAVRRDDWLFLSYRQSAVPILRGLPPERAWLYYRGDPQTFVDPRPYACAPQAVPIATQLPHAVGWAWEQRRRGGDAVAVAFFGDGATSEGDFSEGMNLAGVLRAPVVFLCTNNQWAISTPYERQTAAATIADKAAAYGMPGETVDGFDALAVAEAVGRAAERARAGDGPTLVEARCYRIKGHATADEPRMYRDSAEAERWQEHEPIARLERRLLDEGLVTTDEIERVTAEALQEMREAGRRLDATPAADPELMIRDVYADPPPTLRRRFEEARA